MSASRSCLLAPGALAGATYARALQLVVSSPGTCSALRASGLVAWLPGSSSAGVTWHASLGDSDELWLHLACGAPQ